MQTGNNYGIIFNVSTSTLPTTAFSDPVSLPNDDNWTLTAATSTTINPNINTYTNIPSSTDMAMVLTAYTGAALHGRFNTGSSTASNSIFLSTDANNNFKLNNMNDYFYMKIDSQYFLATLQLALQLGNYTNNPPYVYYAGFGSSNVPFFSRTFYVDPTLFNALLNYNMKAGTTVDINYVIIQNQQNIVTSTGTVNGVNVTILSGVSELTAINLTAANKSASINPSLVYLDYNNGSVNNYTLNSSTSSFTISAVCLHENSKVITETGLKKIKDLTSDDKILSGNNEFAKVLEIVPCWIQIPNQSVHTCVIFEPNALGDNQPSERLIIDPGHPMCTLEEYKNNNVDALRKALDFVDDNNSLIRISNWSDPSIEYDDIYRKRFDIILEHPHSTFIANNIVIKSRKSVEDPGYLHYSGKYM